jgi:hypothetical protein
VAGEIAKVSAAARLVRSRFGKRPVGPARRLTRRIGRQDIPARRATHAATIPYYEFHEVLTVRGEDRDRFRSMADLRGHRVSTLSAFDAHDFLKTQPVMVVSYDDDDASVFDLEQEN